MDKPAKPKDTFYLFRRERKEQEGYEYIQHIVSPSHDNGLSTSCWPKYQDIYKIELGWRHPDIMHRFGKEVSRNPNDQGFYTSKGRFVTRKEGLEIARAAGQVDKIIGGVLTSEDLY